MSLRRAARPLIAASILVLAAVALLPGVLLRGETPSEGDLTRYHRPAKTMMTRLWVENHGPTPEWTPYLSSGQPFRANPHFGAAHPSVLLFRTLPFNAAFLIWVLLPLPLGAAGMFLLLRELGRRPDTSLLMAAAWSLGGFALSTIAMPPIAWTALLAPGAAALVLRVVPSRSPVPTVLAAAGLALCVAGGSPVAIVSTGVLVAAALGSRRMSGQPASPRRVSPFPYLRLAGVCVLAAALAAPVLLPGAALSNRSIRAEDDALKDTDEWSLAPIRLLEPWLPTVAGSAKYDRWSWSRTTYADRSGEPLVASVYPGVLIALLASAAVLTRRRESLPWIVVAAFGTIAALGSATPVWESLLSRLPLLGGIRYPEKWVFLPAVAAIVLAASALDAARDGDRRSRRLVSAGFIAVSSIGFAMAVSVGLRAPFAGVLADLENPVLLQSFATAAAVFSVVALVSFLLWQLALRTGWSWGIVLIGAVVAADLGVAGRLIVETAPAADLDAVPPSLAPLVGPDGGKRLFDLASWQPGCRPLHPALQPRQVQWGIPLVLDHTFDLTQLRTTAHAVNAVAGLGSSRPDLLPVVLARRSVHAVFTCPPDPTAPRLPALVPVPSPNPLVSCAERVLTAEDDSQWADVVRTLDSADLRSTVVVNADTKKPEAAAAACRVGTLETTPDRWRFEAEGAGPEPSFVVITQSWDRYWRARIDGRPVELKRCEVNLSGLWIEPGPHVVELDYRDTTVAAGNAIGLIGLILCAGLVAVGRRHRDDGKRQKTGG